MKVVSRIQMVPSQAKQLNQNSREIQLYEAANPGEYYVSHYSLKHLKTQKIPHQILKNYTSEDIPISVVYPNQAFLFSAPDPDAIQEAMAYALAQRTGRRKIQLQYLGRRRDENEDTFTLDRPGGKRSYQWKVPPVAEGIEDIRDQFPRMINRIKARDTKVILSFGSGGIRLFAHPSLMKFIDLMGLRPQVDEIWGSSGGAIAGLPYSLGVDPEVLEQEGYHLYNDRYSFRFSPSKLEVLKNLVSDIFLPNSDQTLQGFLDVQSHLRDLLEKHLKVTKRKIPFFCVAYNLKERRNEVLTPEEVDPEIYLTPTIHTDALDAVIASSSIPILYVPKKILRGETEHAYIDGGTTEEVPLISPYRKWVRDRMHNLEKRKKLLIISVNLFPEAGMSGLFSHWVFKRIPALKVLQLSANYADLVRQARIDEHKGTLMRDKDVTQWELVLRDTGGGIVNTKMIPRIIETAQTSFYDQLIEIEAGL